MQNNRPCLDHQHHPAAGGYSHLPWLRDATPLPFGWQNMVRANMTPAEQLTWDGQILCKMPHGPGAGPS